MPIPGSRRVGNRKEGLTMAWAQAKQVIAAAGDFHQRLVAYYTYWIEHAPSERLALMLRALADREAKVAQGFREYEACVDSEVMDTWFNFPIDVELPALHDNPVADPGCTTDDLVLLALKHDEALVELYQEAAHRIGTKEGKELFAGLLAMQISEEHRTSKGAMSRL